METEKLIQDLTERTKVNIQQAENFKKLSIDQLNSRISVESWSVLECIEHLNLYGDFYIPEIELRINNSHSSPSLTFKPGILGNYFAKSMLPKEKLNTMKTFKDKNPKGSQLEKSTLDHFLLQQEQILNLLNASRKVNLNKIKTNISISKWIKLKLGDTFRVVIYHKNRHILQAKNILNARTN